MRTDRNVKRLGADTRRFMELLRAVANVRLRGTVEEVPAAGTLKAAEDEIARRGLRHFLQQCRDADIAIRRFEHAILQDVARYFRPSASELVTLIKDARRNLADMRGFIAHVVSERDDEELGCGFVPPAPEGLPASASIEIEDLDLPPCADAFELHFSEAAASQILEMRARAIAEPHSVRALLWNGVHVLLSKLIDPAEVLHSSEVPHDLVGNLAMSSIGKTRLFVAGSVAKRQVTVLLLASWSPGDEWKAAEEVRGRLRSAEWDAVFEELDAYIRPTPRGLAAMLSALDKRAAKGEQSPGETQLLSRLQAAKPFDPVLVEDIRAAAADTAEAAEDIIDNEDADAALLEPDRVAWDDVKSEFDA